MIDFNDFTRITSECVSHKIFKNKVCDLTLKSHCKDWSEQRSTILSGLIQKLPWCPCFLAKEDQCSVVMPKKCVPF